MSVRVRELAQPDQRLAQDRALLADAVHDLLTPLTIIRGHLELLGRHGGDRDAVAETCEIALEELRRVEVLAECLLAVGATHAAPRRTLHVRALVEDAARRWHGIADRDVLSRVATDRAIDCDERSLGGVIDAIVENAQKYSRRGEPIVIAATDAGDSVEVAVSDRGCGIPSEIVPRVFDRAFRTHATAARGSGLGLALAREVVAAHGGTIDISSVVGGGTTVTVRLPAVVTRARSAKRRKRVAP